MCLILISTHLISASVSAIVLNDINRVDAVLPISQLEGGGGGGNISSTNKSVTYSTNELRFDYPSDWELSPDNNNTYIQLISPHHVTFLVTAKLLPKNTTLEQYTIFHIHELNRTLGGLAGSNIMGTNPFVVNESLTTVLGDGIPAHKLGYSFICMPDNLTCDATEIWSVKSGKVFAIKYYGVPSIPSDDLQQIKNMIDSFAILPH
jgi:hypothetical protein